MDLSAGALRDILSFARSDILRSLLVFLVLQSLVVISSSVPRIVSDVRPSHPSSTPAIPVAPRPLVSSSSLPSSTPL